jgi:hypothetical protein
MLFDSPDALPLITPTWSKRYLDLTQDQYWFQDTPLPLAAIYLLDGRQDDADDSGVEAVLGADALITLIAHTYVNYLLDQSVRAAEFDFLADLLGQVPVRRVTAHGHNYPIHQLCDVILDDFRAQLSPATQHGHDGHV